MHIAKLLLERCYEVVKIDNLNDDYELNLKLTRLEKLKPFSNFKFVQDAYKFLYTGCGIREYSIIDRWYVADKSPKTACLSCAAREVNRLKLQHVINKVKAVARKFKNLKIARPSLAFKADTMVCMKTHHSKSYNN